ncbi:MAG: AMP-binding protein [Fibrobacteraceae bacterium]|nr:AMP-binding protein [Fibrobacteraceae bacterium]
MKTVAGKILFTALTVLYPGLVFCGLYFWGISPRILSLALIVLALFHFTSSRKAHKGVNAVKGMLFFSITLACGCVAFALDSKLFLKFYPVFINLVLLLFFGLSLKKDASGKRSSLVFQLACLGDKTLAHSSSRSFVEKYCRKVTLVWCFFFVANGTVALLTIASGSDKWWALYNGLVSYILMGMLFAGEFMIRSILQKKLNSYIPVSKLERDSRPAGAPVAFSQQFNKGLIKTWGHFTADVSKLRQEILSKPKAPWILHSENTYLFLAAFMALLQTGRTAMVTANKTPQFIGELQKKTSFFLTDEPFEGATLIQDVLARREDDGSWSSFDPNNEFYLYTSGTTGEPKAVFKRFIQLENELYELVKVYGSEYVDRNIYSTVNHHHIYGLLFTVFLPIAIGRPLCDKHFDVPEELSLLVDEKCVLVASPAYMKRLTSSVNQPIPFKVSPMVHSSGGALPEETAQKMFQLVGSWPNEIYGSTETGGIAYRQQKDGASYKPFEVCKMSIAENGCLNVKSNYILEPEGFTTGDLAQIYDDGRFLLKGRADNIVKIEEKRISLPEVENRIRQSGLVQDCRAVPMSGKRQYLAAAIVLNQQGKEKFKDTPKLEINKFFRNHLAQFLEATVIPKKWRYLRELPQDSQGKIKVVDIQALFRQESDSRYHLLSIQTDEENITAKISVPETSDYYDGHFPEFKLLPAVVQVDLVAKLAHQHLKASLKLDRISRTKFASPIFPDTPFVLSINYKKDTGRVSFNYTDEASGKTLSSGIFFLVVEQENA